MSGVPALDPLLSEEGWAYASLPPQEPGDPGRFHALFGRDSLICALQVLPAAPEVARATLRALAARQGRVDDPETDEEPGKILHEYRPVAGAWFAETGWPVRDGGLLYYGTADATSWFLVVLAALGRRRAHRGARARVACGRRLARPCARSRAAASCATARAAAPAGSPSRAGATRSRPSSTTRRAPASSARTAPSRRRRWPTPTARRPRWRRSTRSRRLDPAGDWPARASALRAGWPPGSLTPGAGLRRSDRGRRRTSCAGRGSQLGWLLWAGALEGDAAAAAAERLVQPDVLTDFGLRTLSSSHPAFRPHAYHRGGVWPFDCWLGWGGLRAAGRAAEAERVRTGVLIALDRLGLAPELYAVTAAGELEPVPVANRVQAWTVGARWALEHDWDGRQ